MMINILIEDEQPIDALKGISALVAGISDTNRESPHLYTTEALRIVEVALYEVISKLEKKEENKN